MKAIIERALPLNLVYTLIDKTYVPMADSYGCSCDNCGKLISNIATVKNSLGNTYTIGFDCLETLLINNNILENKSLDEYLNYKSQLPTIIKKSKELNEIIISTNKKNDVKITEIEFDKTDFELFNKYGKSSFLSFNYIFQNGRKYNSNIRVKNDFNLVNFFDTLNVISKIKISSI